MVLKWDGQSLFVMNQDFKWYKNSEISQSRNIFRNNKEPILLKVWLYLFISYSKMQTPLQRCQPSLFQREAPYFCRHFCPFWHPNLVTSLFLASFAIEVACNFENLIFCLNPPYCLDVNVGIFAFNALWMNCYNGNIQQEKIIPFKDHWGKQMAFSGKCLY